MNENAEMSDNDRADRDLIAYLGECHESCLEGMVHSLDEGGDYAKTDHIRWLFSCAEICRLAADFVIVGSEYAGDMLSTCAFICEDCAESCETFFDDENMKHCAEICRNCARICRDSIEEEDEDEMEEEEELESDEEQETKEEQNK